MALESRIRPRVLWFNVGYAVMCVALGAWGAYDYWERIPRQEAEFAEYKSATERVKHYSDMSVPGGPRLTSEQDADYQRAREVVDKYASGAPTPVAAYDRPLQLWVYMIGCGLLGTAWCAITLARTVPRTFRLDDDGTLHVGARAIPQSEVSGIDMSRWMAKSIATLQVREGEPVVLDDYKFGGMHLMVGSYAHRFEPARWNPDATPVKRAGDPGQPAAASRDAAGATPRDGTLADSGTGAPAQDRFPSA